MSIDSDAKRASILGICGTTMYPLVSTVQADWQQIAGLYRGILAGEAVEVVVADLVLAALGFEQLHPVSLGFEQLCPVSLGFEQVKQVSPER